MVFLNQILFKYYENWGIRYILYYPDIHQKELKSIHPVLLNPGAPLLFVARSTLVTKVFNDLAPYSTHRHPQHLIRRHNPLKGIDFGVHQEACLKAGSTVFDWLNFGYDTVPF